MGNTKSKVVKVVSEVKENQDELIINKLGMKRFLDSISLSGENQIKEALITIKKDSISALVKSPTNTVALSAVLTGLFNELGEIGIDDLSLLKSALNIQDKEEVTIKIKDNKLNICSAKTKASLLLRGSDYIKNKAKEEDFNKYIESSKGNEFNLSSEEIDRINRVYSLIKSETVTIVSTNGNSVKFIFNKLDNEIETEIDLDSKIEPFKVIVNSYLLIILNFLEEATISIKKESGILYILYKKPDLEIKYILSTIGK